MGEARLKQQRSEVLEQRVSEGDLAYLRVIRRQAQEAAKMEQEAAQHEQRAQALRAQAAALYGAHQSFSAHLCERYGLDQQADGIADDGRIVRASDQGAELPVEAPTPNGVAAS